MSDEEEIMYVPPPDSETVCNICYAEFVDPEDLGVHISQVHADSGMRCQFCVSIFLGLDDYAKHVRDTHLLDMRACRLCSKIFIGNEKKTRHERRHSANSSKETYRCSQCASGFRYAHEVELHEKKFHDNSEDGVYLTKLLPILSSYINMKLRNFISNTSYNCSICSYKSSRGDEYIHHLRDKNCRSLVCDHCSSIFKQKKYLSKHLRQHLQCNHMVKEEDVKDTCTKCGEQFDLISFKTHVMSCKPIKCSLCNTKFVSVQLLSQHQSEEHPMAITMTVCSFCHREFVGSVQMQKHINRCHKDLHLYKYTCLSCEGKYFKHPKRLFAHYFSKHIDLKPYSCKICDMQFRVRKKFTLHIKIAHDSNGFVEFDENYHVFFTATKSSKPFQPKSLFGNETVSSVDGNSDDNEPKTNNDMDISQLDAPTDCPTECPTDVQTDVQTDTEDAKKKASRKPLKIRLKEEKSKENLMNASNDQNVGEENQKMNKSRKRSNKEIVSDTNVSDSDDEPLHKVRKRIKKSQRKKRVVRKHKKSTRSFTCDVCNKYCYTYQNFNLHMSMHYSNEAKKCVKCNKEFYSKAKLEAHIAVEHKSSRLTETLKTILERRKRGTNRDESNLSNTEKFQQTIKKVISEPVDAAAVIKEIKEDISVQKYIENFTPDDANKKTDNNIYVKIATVNNPAPRKPMIKMTKFEPKPLPETTKLAFPVKFKNVVYTVTPKVRITVVQRSLEPEYQEDYDHDDFLDDHIEDQQLQKNDVIPDVAQEVMLEAQEPKQMMPYKVVIPQLPKEVANKDIKIAHLLPEAPYYKIVRMSDVLKQNTSEQAEKDALPENIQLPSGKKLVNVNPLAHLIGDRPINKILGTKKPNNQKVRNFETAIAKALLKLEKSVPRRRKKKNIVNDDSSMVIEQ